MWQSVARRRLALPRQSEAVAKVAVVLREADAGTVAQRERLTLGKGLLHADPPVMLDDGSREEGEQRDPRVGPAVTKQVGDNDPPPADARHLAHRGGGGLVVEVMQKQRRHRVIERAVGKGKAQRVGADV